FLQEPLEIGHALAFQHLCTRASNLCDLASGRDEAGYGLGDRSLTRLDTWTWSGGVRRGRV
ncbi:MAG TPA: hypothetical protein VI756_26465, partial [Blastocatellia bacterium]